MKKYKLKDKDGKLLLEFDTLMHSIGAAVLEVELDIHANVYIYGADNFVLYTVWNDNHGRIIVEYLKK